MSCRVVYYRRGSLNKRDYGASLSRGREVSIDELSLGQGATIDKLSLSLSLRQGVSLDNLSLGLGVPTDELSEGGRVHKLALYLRERESP